MVPVPSSSPGGLVYLVNPGARYGLGEDAGWFCRARRGFLPGPAAGGFGAVKAIPED